MDINNRLKEMLFGRQELMKKFNRDMYADTFHAYYSENEDLFKTIDEEYKATDGQDAYLQSIAQAFVDFAKSEVDKRGKKADKERFLVEHNSVLIVYMIPALVDSRLESLNVLAKMIIDKWNATFKGHTLSVGTFTEIDAGFKRKLCYITTAVCETLGKPDDCYELKLLRDYRDGYLASCEDGEKVIKEYYNVAPTIVNRINKKSESAKIYSDIYSTYISPCISYIESGKNEECRTLYTNMVYELKSEYMG